jgi:hypothetical protein
MGEVVRVECIKHGEVEGFRNPKGQLVCSICTAAKQEEAKETYDDTVRREQARKVVEHLFDPERMAAHRREREARFKECLVDAMAERFKEKKP